MQTATIYYDPEKLSRSLLQLAIENRIQNLTACTLRDSDRRLVTGDVVVRWHAYHPWDDHDHDFEVLIQAFATPYREEVVDKAVVDIKKEMLHDTEIAELSFDITIQLVKGAYTEHVPQPTQAPT